MADVSPEYPFHLSLIEESSVVVSAFLGEQYRRNVAVAQSPEEQPLVTFRQSPECSDICLRDKEDGSFYPVIEAGIGTCAFTWRGHHFFYDCDQLGAPVGTRGQAIRYTTNYLAGPTYEICQSFLRLAHSFHAEQDSKTVAIYRNNAYGHWGSAGNIQVKGMEHMYLDSHLAQDIQHTIDQFIADKERCLRFGRYRYCFLLAGLPGSGKTSLVKALARHYRRSIYSLTIDTNLTDSALIMCINHIKQESILLIEDIDTWFEGRQVRADINVSFSAMLNILDGVHSRGNGLLTFITTNHPDRLDAALVRPGRVDRIVTFTWPTRGQIMEAFQDLTQPRSHSQFPADHISSYPVPSHCPIPSGKGKSSRQKEEEERESRRMRCPFEKFYAAVTQKPIGMAAIVDYLFRYPQDYLQHLDELLDQNYLYHQLITANVADPSTKTKRRPKRSRPSLSDDSSSHDCR